MGDKIVYVCSGCGTTHTFSELKMADNGIDYTYYCKKCNDVIESNGRYYGAAIAQQTQPKN